MSVKCLTFFKIKNVIWKNLKLQRQNFLKFRDTEFRIIPRIFANSLPHTECTEETKKVRRSVLTEFTKYPIQQLRGLLGFLKTTV
jgi:hypothetical protein